MGEVGRPPGNTYTLLEKYIAVVDVRLCLSTKEGSNGQQEEGRGSGERVLCAVKGCLFRSRAARHLDTLRGYADNHLLS